jgi:hypothetical protein
MNHGQIEPRIARMTRMRKSESAKSVKSAVQNELVRRVDRLRLARLFPSRPGGLELEDGFGAGADVEFVVDVR